MDMIIWLALVGSNAGLGYIGMVTDLNDTLRYPISHDYKFNGVAPHLEGPVQDVKNMALVMVVFMCLLTYVSPQHDRKMLLLTPRIQKLAH